MQEKFLYVKKLDNTDVFIFRQVDNVAIASPYKETAEAIIRKIGSFIKSLIIHEGLTEIFNGVDVDQTKRLNEST